MTAKPWGECPECLGTGKIDEVDGSGCTKSQRECPCAAARQAAFDEIGGDKLATAIPAMVEYVKTNARWCEVTGKYPVDGHTCQQHPDETPCRSCRARALLASAGIEWKTDAAGGEREER